ncbi:hypothetical protein KO507_02180 [Gilvimarinus agarilyticus]|nr:hypothetical protein [Gilvimarinus agarilyticus]
MQPLFNHFKNAETVQFSDNVLTILAANDPTALNVAPQVSLLDERFQGLKKLFILDQGNAITAEIQDLDGRRDDALIGINANVDSYQKHYAETSRTACEALRKLLDKHGRDLYRKSYPEETAGIRSMIDEIEAQTSLTEAAATLHLTEWFAELKTANDLFDTKYLERNEAYADAPKEKFAEVREQTEAAYLTLTKHLSAYAVINPSEAYDRVISQIEQLVESYNQTVKNRQSAPAPEEEV